MSLRQKSREKVHHCRFLNRQQFLVALFDKNKKEICLQISVLSQSNPSIHQAMINDKNIPSALGAVCQNSLEAIYREIEEVEYSDLRIFLNAQNGKIGIAIEVELFGKEVKRDVYLDTLVFQPINSNKIEAKVQEMLKIQRESYQLQIKAQREEFQKQIQRERESNDYIIHLSNMKRHIESSLKEMEERRKSEMTVLQRQLQEERRQRCQYGQSTTHRLQALQNGFNKGFNPTTQNSSKQARMSIVQLDPQLLQTVTVPLSHKMPVIQIKAEESEHSSQQSLRILKSKQKDQSMRP